MSFERLTNAGNELFAALEDSLDAFWQETLRSFRAQDGFQKSPPLGFFDHYKGGRYGFLGTATQESDGVVVAIYRHLETGALYTRPAAEFFGEVEVNGKSVPRFQRVSP